MDPDTTLSLQEPERLPELHVMENFAMVTRGVYRSSFPRTRHIPFLKKLGLRTVLTLVPEEVPRALRVFYEETGVNMVQIGMPGNKEPFVDIPDDAIALALCTLLDTRAHPVLIHCNKGKHRTGCLVGCLRKLQNWSHSAICNEYRRFAAPKERALDQQFIELFDVGIVQYLPKHAPSWLRPVA